MSTPPSIASGTFCLVLHTHLPFVLNHGRWPHGADWLNEAAIESYIPLLEAAQRLVKEGISPRWTVGLSPVLAEQLAAPGFQRELQFFLEERFRACRENRKEFLHHRLDSLGRLTEFWEERLTRVQDFLQRLGGDLLGAFRRLEREGHLELLTCAATHGYLPLLGRDESLRLQLRTAVETHRRHFGREPRGIWLPECAYRPRTEWVAPVGPARTHPPRGRAGIEEFLAEVGLEYFITDTHMVTGGRPLAIYRSQFLPPREQPILPSLPMASGPRGPYSPYEVGSAKGHGSAIAFVRDPRTTLQVWSRDFGYPGDPWYLEFHKKHWPGGLRYWRVSEHRGDLGAKQIYDPKLAAGRVGEHAAHFLGLVKQTLSGAEAALEAPALVCAPYDAELFGHWWYEGPAWLEEVGRLMARFLVRPRTLGESLALHPPQESVSLQEGSWGDGGDHRVWLNPDTEWIWERIYDAETSFFDLTATLPREGSHPLLPRLVAQAGRELLLLQASDWPFLITTQSARDYAERRVTAHAGALKQLLDLIRKVTARGQLSNEDDLILREIEETDHLFPNLTLAWAHEERKPP